MCLVLVIEINKNWIFAGFCDYHGTKETLSMELRNYCPFNHGTIARTGMTCEKIPYYMHNSTCRWRIIKKTEIFWSDVKHFWILLHVRNSRILIGLCKKVFVNQPILFLYLDTKRKLVPASFSCFSVHIIKYSKYISVYYKIFQPS